MINEAIRQYQKAEPFRLFEIELVTGRVLVVRHPEFVSAPPVRTGEFVFWHPKGSAESVNGMLVVAVRPHENGHSSRGGKRRRSGP